MFTGLLLFHFPSIRLSLWMNKDPQIVDNRLKTKKQRNKKRNKRRLQLPNKIPRKIMKYKESFYHVLDWCVWEEASRDTALPSGLTAFNTFNSRTVTNSSVTDAHSKPDALAPNTYLFPVFSIRHKMCSQALVPFRRMSGMSLEIFLI